MKITELSVRRPVTVVMIYLLICVIACVYIPRLGIALFPDSEFPVLSVYCAYNGVGPEEVDENVSQVLIEKVKGVSGIQKLTSVAEYGYTYLILEFDYDKDMDEAKDDVEQALSGVTSLLPDNVTSPAVRKFDMSSMPIMKISVDGDADLGELSNLAEDTVKPLLQRVNGVASVDTRGDADLQVKVDVIYNRLEAYGLTLSQISSALAARNIQLSAGDMTIEGMDYEVITAEYYGSLDEIRNTVITTINDVPIKVDDVANVYEEYDQTGRKVYINGERGIFLNVTNESDANASTVAKAVKKALPKINEALPSGITARVISDDTTMIDSTMKEVYLSAIEGALLAFLIIFIFLRNFKCSIIIALSIPISILITLMCMAMMGLTVNLMTMAGLILGMGMVVDSSIVILENIFNHREKGEKPAIAAILGSDNMINAIVASTLTTLCVFVPILIYKTQLEMIGQMFEEMVITVVISLVASLFVAVTLVPALCGSITPIYTRKQKPLKNPVLKKIDDAMEKFFKGMDNGYAKCLEFCLKNKLLVICLVLSMLILSITSFSKMGFDLSPRSDSDDQVTVTLTLPVGTNKDVVVTRLFEFQELVEKECAGSYETIVLTSGTSNSGEVQINLPELSKQTMSPNDIKAKIMPYMSSWSDTTVEFSAGRGPSSSKPIDVTIASEDEDELYSVSDDVFNILTEKVPQCTDIENDLTNGSPRYTMSIDKDAAYAAGVTVSTIATELYTAVNGTTATSFYQNGDEVDIIVTIQDSDVISTKDLLALSVTTSNGRMTLDNFINIEEGKSPQQIQREDGERINHISAKIIDGVSTSEAQALVEQAINEYLVLPENTKISYNGDAADISKFGSAFIVVIILAIFLVFAVMAAQFESLIDPFIIFISIPLLAIGVVAVYRISGQTLSMYSIVGIVSLVGIVVNNGIVLVDFTNQLVDKKTPVFEACVEAGRNRLRPILMSTLTTVIGMVPMAFFPGEGAETMQPICITIVGGLLSGAFMTLFITPIMYYIFNKRREKRFDDPMALVNQLSEYDERIGRKKV